MTELKAVKINETDALLQWLSEPGDLEYTIKQNCSDGESTNHYNSRSTDIESVCDFIFWRIKITFVFFPTIEQIAIAE